MTDDEVQRTPNDRPERAKPEQPDQEARQGQPSGVGGAAQPGKQATPGRKPLFRN
jgi:hypothetical protein